MEKQNLFDRAYKLEQEILTLNEDLKELKGEFVYHKEYCPNGFPKAEVVKVMKAAKSKVHQDNLQEKATELLEINDLIDEYSN